MFRRKNNRRNGRNMDKEYGFEGFGQGLSGKCICVKCGYSSAKKRAIPCKEEKCPNCGTILLRENGFHHNQYLKRQR
jgi:hypothetical protein